jgi:hypothetical protein
MDKKEFLGLCGKIYANEPLREIEKQDKGIDTLRKKLGLTVPFFKIGKNSFNTLKSVDELAEIFYNLGMVSSKEDGIKTVTLIGEGFDTINYPMDSIKGLSFEKSGNGNSYLITYFPYTY